MSANDQILTEVDGFIGRFTINNAAKRNCMTLSMWQRMGDVFAAWADDPEVRVIIVRGAGEQCFCAGNDISEFAELRSSPENIANYTAVTDRAYALFKAVPKPTIARIAGFCIGGELEMAQLCDIQIAADTATFGVTPAKLGLGYKLNDVQLLTDNVGAKVAKEMLLTARQFPADDALRWGLVNRVVAEHDLDESVESYAHEIAANAPLSVKAAKIIVAEASKETAHRDTLLCQALVDACHESNDYQEGQRAFAEKRLPEFKGT